MKFDFTETALHDNFKFRVKYEFKDSFAEHWSTKLAKHLENFPDDDTMAAYIRQYVEPNIIIEVWKTNTDTGDSWIGQYFIAPKIWREEIIARLMQTSTDLVETIINEITIKTKKAIWDLVVKKEEKFKNEYAKKSGTDKDVPLKNEKVAGRIKVPKNYILADGRFLSEEEARKVYGDKYVEDRRKDIAERINKIVDKLNKKNEEKHMRTLKEIDLNTAFTSDEFTIVQNNDSGKIEIKMVFTGRSKKEFIRELTANEMHYVSEFAKFFIKDVVAQITWESKYICGEEMYNSGSIEKTFLGDGKKDLIDEVFNYARAISDIEVYANDSNASEVLAKYNAWLEKVRRIYMETFYAESYTFEFDSTNDANYCAFKIKKENSPNEMTIIMVADKDAKISSDKEDISFKDVLKEILINSTVNGDMTSTRYKMDDLKNCYSLFYFLKEKTIGVFGDLNVTKIYDSEKFVTISNWLSDLVNIAKEKAAKEEEVPDWPPKDCHIEAFYPFKTKFFIEDVKIEFETKVNFKDVKGGRMTLDEVTKALTRNAMHWHIKFLEPARNRRTEFDAVDVLKCNGFEEFIQYFKKLMSRAKIEFDEADNHRRAILKLADTFRAYIDKQTAKIVPEKTAEELVKELIKNTVEEIKKCFEQFNRLDNEHVRLMQQINSGKYVFRDSLEKEIQRNENELNKTKQRFYQLCDKLLG